jgi:hypothetical protein
MAKRKSFDDKSKGMHKSRKLIIDTVFGREDNTQRVFGYEKAEDVTKREVGERWTDSEGKEWEQKDGFKVSVSQMDDVRQFLQKMSTCHSETCETKQYSKADKKLIVKTGYCITCLAKFETKLKADGVFNFYEDYKITLNKLGFIRDFKQKCEDSLKSLKTNFQTVTEDGRLENWDWQVDIEQVRKDLKSDIDNSYEAIELLLERKRLLEEKFIELKRPELIKK